MDRSDRSSTLAGGPGQTVCWLIAVLLAASATALWLRPGGALVPAARAQNQPLAGARGIFAFTGPLDRDQYGLFMLDVDQGTIWCYGFERVNGVRKLRLIAGRSWIYDRYLQDFNCAAPDFRMVRELVSQQRAQSAADLPPPSTVDEQPDRAPEDDQPPGG